MVEAVIFAAGKGARMGYLTKDTQKCLLTVGGKPILQRNIENLISEGVDKCIILANYKSQDIQKFLLESHLDNYCELVHTNEVSTGKSLLKVIDDLGDYFFISHGDIIFSRNDLHNMVEFYSSIKKKNPLASVLGTVPVSMNLTHTTTKSYQEHYLEILDCVSYDRTQKIDPRSDAYSCGLGIINHESFDNYLLSVLDKPMIEAGLLKPSKNNLVFEFKMSNDCKHMETAEDYEKITRGINYEKLFTL